MNILAIDTSSEYLSLALQKGLRQQHILEKVGKMDLFIDDFLEESVIKFDKRSRNGTSKKAAFIKVLWMD